MNGEKSIGKCSGDPVINDKTLSNWVANFKKEGGRGRA